MAADGVGGEGRHSGTDADGVGGVDRHRGTAADGAGKHRLTGLEFEMLWAAYGRDRLPYPLHYRTQITEFDELERARDAALTALLQKYSPELEHAIEVLLEPDARVESKGFSGPYLSQPHRFHGAIRDRMGATLTQLPGVTADTGGDVLITYCTAQQVCSHAVAAVPRRDAGTHPRLELRREEIAADRDRHVRRAHDYGPIEQLDRIFQRTRSGLGEVTIYAGPAVDARPTPGRGFWWMDYPDGRYYVKTGDPIIAAPMSPQAMAAEIHRLLTLTQRYHHEDRAHDEYLRSRH